MNAVILAYHRVASLSTDPLALAVSPDRFDEQLAALRNILDPMPLSALVTSLKEGRDPQGVVLTFDDGYADNAISALPLLERHGVPATVFVATGYLGGEREFWWDELERVLLLAPSFPESLRLRIRDREIGWTLDVSDRSQPGAASLAAPRSPTPRHVVYEWLCRRLRWLSADERESLLEELRTWASVDDQPRSSHRPLTERELVELARSDLIDIGAHTVEHGALSALSASAQRTEIEASRETLERVLDTKVVHFSYPFGRGRPPRKTYDRQSVGLVRRAGYDAACSLKPAPRLRPSLYELPRVLVRDWDGDQLLRRLRR